MNHPDGNCPLCLYPLFREDAGRLPFMKLMSCFHCFHSECILRWWKWLQQQTEDNVNNQLESIRSSESQKGTHVSVSQRLGNCPVCRMVFHSKDIEHVLDLLETCMPEVSFEVTGPEDGGEPEVLRSDAENTRRQKFDSLLKLQQENSGLIEPKKDLVVEPGMFLPERVTHPTASSGNSIEHTEDGQFNMMPGADLNNTSSTPTTNGQKGSSARRGRAPNPRKHVNAQASRKQWSAQPSRKQWIKKENGLDN